jgi:mRNA interferase MazF
MEINQGDLFWVDLPEPTDAEPGYRRPCVVIQNNLFNHSRIRTVVICLLTSNMKRAQSPANVLLRAGEAGLPKQSVVNLSQIYTVGKLNLSDKIGTLSKRRIREVLDGLLLLTEPHEIDD